MTTITSKDLVCQSSTKCDKGGRERKKCYLICNPSDTAELWKGEELQIMNLNINEESFSMSTGGNFCMLYLSLVFSSLKSFKISYN